MRALFETQKRKTNGAFTFSSKMEKSAIKYKSILKICPRPSVKFLGSQKGKAVPQYFRNIAHHVFLKCHFWDAENKRLN